MCVRSMLPQVLNVVALCLVITSGGKCRTIDGCTEGSIIFNSNICITVTQPGTWFEATSSCPFPSANSFRDGGGYFDDPIPQDDETLMLKMGVKEVWLLEKDVLLYGDNVGQNKISGVPIWGQPSKPDFEKQSYVPTFLSRWKYMDTLNGACTTYNLQTSATNLRSCSSDSSDLKFPAVCWSWRTSNDSIIDHRCPDGFTTEFGLSSICSKLITEKDIANKAMWGDAKSVCSSLGPGVFPLDSADQTLTAALSSLGCNGDFLPFQQLEEMPKRPALLDVNETNSIQCVLCHTKRRLNQSIALTPTLLDKVSNLKLTIYNYDRREKQSILCYTDSSTHPHKFELFIDQCKSEEDKPSVYLKKSIINDVFYLKIIGNHKTNINDDNDSTIKVKESLIYYNYTEGVEHLNVEILANGSGTYRCMGINKTNRLPIYTETVDFVTAENRYVRRYVATVEVDPQNLREQMIYPNNILVGTKISSTLAKVLNVTDGIIELRSITNSEAHLLFHVTLPDDHTPLRNGKQRFNMDDVAEGVEIITINVADMSPNITVDNKISAKLSAELSAELETRHRGNWLDRINFTGDIKSTGAVETTTEGLKESVSEPTRRVSTSWTEKFTKPSTTAAPTEETLLPGKTTVAPPTPNEAVNILHNLTQEPVHCTQLPAVTSLIDTILSSADAASSDTLQDLDIILTNMILDPGIEEIQSVESNVAILVGDLQYANPVVGISFVKNKEEVVLYPIKYLSINDTSQLHANQTEVSVQINRVIISDNTRLAFVVYTNTILFYDESKHIEVNSQVLNILLSKGEDAMSTFPKGEFIDIFLRPHRARNSESETQACAFWNVERESWSEDGCVLQRKTDEGMDVCRCYHLTHFGEIITIGGSPLPPGHQTALEVISIAGCSFSLFGLLVIALTAFVFKNWRAELGNKILLNLSAALTLNLVTFLLVHGGVGGKEGPDCITIGVILHYSVLACFSWMLVMSGLQVMRLLTVLGNKRFSNLLLKSSIFAWGLPLVPIIILLAVDPTIYSSSTSMSFDRGFCYPRGAAYYATIAAPVAVIIVINVVIYILIICRICSCFGWGAVSTGQQRHGIPEALLAMRRLRTLIFLYFLFGITWIFGFLVQYLFFAYLFCITATLQGFVIFVFFFVIEKKSRGYWKKMWLDASSSTRSYMSRDDISGTLFETVRLNDDVDIFSQERNNSTNIPDADTATRSDTGEGGIVADDEIETFVQLRTKTKDKGADNTYESFGLPSFLDEEQSRRTSASESRRRSTFQTFK